jgi:exopolyphosphatase / guanosine-5'-triphosphate,3'-diphosphate pyrophosphatase
MKTDVPEKPAQPPPAQSALFQQPTRRAVIDVGTNSVKLLIADVSGGDLTPLVEDSNQTRLGRGFYETHHLQSEAIQQTASVVAAYAQVARDWNAETVRVLATSAVRDAENARELLDEVQRSSGLALEIISGEQEADYAYQGVCSDPKLDGLPLLILDVGGGSTEFIAGEKGHKYYRNSFPLGTVRLFERFQPADPPGAEMLGQCRNWIARFLEERVAPELRPAISRCKVPPLLVGTGGTTTILARLEGGLLTFERDRIESTVLSRAQLTERVEALWSLPVERRKALPGMPPKRADIIIFGVAIYEAVMNCFQFSELRVSTRGLRFAAVLDPATKPC